IVGALTRRAAGADRVLHIEDVQDQVELALMRGEHHKVARAYVLYREERARARRAAEAAIPVAPAPSALQVRGVDGILRPLGERGLRRVVDEACAGLADVDASAIRAETRRNLYDGISLAELALAPVMAARTLVESEPNYAFVSARLLLDMLRAEAVSF